MESEAKAMRAALSAAVRRFPEFELTIRRLIEADQSFRDMCEELVEAETALKRVERLPEPTRAARKAEWQDLVARLIREIEVALQEDQAVAQSRIDKVPRQ